MGGIGHRNEPRAATARQWIGQLRRFAMVVLVVIVSAAVAPAAEPPRYVPVTEFRLLEGDGVAVCQAYLRFLQKTDFYAENTGDPYCYRPQLGRYREFGQHARVPLDYQEKIKLYDEVFSFVPYGNQDSYRSRPAGPYLPESEKERRGLMRETQAWRYQPPMDVDGDGRTDPIQVWSFSSRHPGECVENQQIHPTLFVSHDGERIDTERTIRVFGTISCASGQCPNNPNNRPWVVDRFGTQEVFSYRGHVFIDAWNYGPLRYGLAAAKGIPKRQQLRGYQIDIYRMPRTGETPAKVCAIGGEAWYTAAAAENLPDAGNSKD